jgi:carboxyl-terminal processing protease
MKKYPKIWLAGLLIASIGFFAFRPNGPGGRYFEIAKNLEIFTNVFKELNTGYVDELDPSKLMRTGVDAMMNSLDPYTNYISETDIEGYRILTEGKYNGIGADSRKMGDFVTITELVEGSPANKAGLKVGDQLTAIDGQSAKGKSVEAVMDILRGFPGTEVDIEVKRPGQTKNEKITLKRDEITVSNVPYHGMVSPEIGYVNLTTFTRDAGANIQKGFEDLKKMHPDMKGLILDLRDNGGGLLAEAVNLVNVFVPKGEVIVTTKGKVEEWDRTFKTLNKPVDETMPVVVLVNHMSASASEITCGALQDLDRAVVMGQRSYGKGLVQNTRDVGFNAKIKLTTAKYYIPSGRCIQAVKYKNGEPVDVPENERAQFKTRGGRLILDGGGVKPDLFLPIDSASGITRALLEKNVIFNFVTDWSLKHPAIDSADVFKFEEWSNFTQFVGNQAFTYEIESEKKLHELEKAAAKDKYMTFIGTEIKALESKISTEKKGDLEKFKPEIVREIEREIVSRYYFERGKVKKSLKNDDEIKAAIQLLLDPAKYKSLLGK